MFRSRNSFEHPVLTQFLETVGAARTTSDPKLLSNCLNLAPDFLLQNASMLALIAEIRHLSSLRLAIEEALGTAWPGFVDLTAAYLEYATSIDPAMMSDVKPMLVWFGNMEKFMGVANPVFNSAQGAIMATVMKVASTLCASSALRIDALSGNPRRPCSHAAMNILLRSFNSTLGERTIASSNPTLKAASKKAATLCIANNLFKLYFKLNQVRLCATIHNNIISASIPPFIHLYPKSEWCTYTYYHGLHYLYKDQFTNAFNTLLSAYELTRPQDIQQRRMIARHMITAALILGNFPSQSLLARPECTGFAEMFYPICHAVRNGDFRGFRRALGDEGPETWRRDWWVKTQLYLTLKSRCQILLWRGLVRKTFLITRPYPNIEGTKPPIVQLNNVLTLGRFLHGPARKINPLFLGQGSDSGQDSDGDDYDETSYFGLEMEMVDVECAVISLLDQGFVKGYITRQASGPLVVLGKSEPFPLVAELYRRLASRERLTDEDGMDSDYEAGNPGGGKVVRLTGVKPIGFGGP